MRALLVLIPVLLVAAGCGSSTTPTTPKPEEGSTPEAGETAGVDGSALEAMRADIAKLQAKAELEVEEMTVQHILIAFAGAMRSSATRSKEEAEQLAADLYQRVNKGEDFRTLMQEFSNDPGGGIYTMVSDPAKQSIPEKFARSGMVPAFGNVGWRLEVNETGVAPHDATSSPFGWHIIQRVE